MFEKKRVKTNQVLITTHFKFFESRKHHTAYVVAEDVLQLEPDVGLLRRARRDLLGNLGPVGGDGDALPAVDD